MASNNQDETGLVLRDLQSLLHQTMDAEVSVVDYQTTPLLVPGENYASTMMKVDAAIKRKKNSEEEKLFLVAKMIPQTEFHRATMDLTASFVKEIFVFEKLLPAYRELQRESGFRDEDLIDILPKFYGGRLTLNKEKPGISDENSVLLMENLNVRGYYTADRKKGMDFDHAKLAMTELARYHALGIALKQKRPQFYEECKKSIDILPFQLSALNDVVEHTIKLILKDQRIAKYEERVKSSLDKIGGWEAFTNMRQVEPWLTIIHGDFWVNNVMFHKVTDERTDVKFVDFQLSRMASPLKDLPYFLCASTSTDVIDNNFNELLDIYHGKLIEVLKKMGCDVAPFSKQSFDEQLKIDGNGELFHCAMALKFFTLDVDKDTDTNDLSSIMFNEGNSLFFDRIWKIFSKFLEMGWI